MQHPEPLFHEGTGTVRFWTLIDDAVIGASVSRETLHYRFRPDAAGEDPMQTFAAHLRELEDAVRRRVAAGSREPVMLREFDLKPVAPSA